MLDLSLWPVFFLVFIRSSAFVVTSPLLAIPGIPNLVKGGFSFILAVVIYPLLSHETVKIVDGLWGYGLLVLSETAVGLGMGLICTMVFNSLRMAGQFIDMQIGYAMAQMMDPIGGGMNTLIGRFLYYMAIAVFFCMDGHYGLIWGLAESYQLLPLGTGSINGDVTLFLIRVFADAITMSLKVAIPVIVVLLMTDLALGIMGRTAPQMNVFMLGFGLKIVIGLISLAILLPLLGNVFQSIFDQMQNDLMLLVKGLT